MEHSENSLGIYLLGAVLIAITAFVYSYLLTQPGEFFGKAYGFFNWLFMTDKRIQKGKGIHPIFKMIMYCEKCVAGQLATWIFLSYTFDYYVAGNFIVVVPHILFVGLSIFLTPIIKHFYTKYIENGN